MAAATRAREDAPMKRARATKDPEDQAAAATRAIAAYLAALPPPVRARMRRIRAIIRAAAPGAVEHFSYGAPGFRLDGRPLAWYAAFRRHIGLYPMTPALLRAHRIDVSDYETSKGTIRLPLDEPLPAPLVKRLVKARRAAIRSKMIG
jgi:uncharacterized protein YdhG (YjbR/CyaY superfamily)